MEAWQAESSNVMLKVPFSEADLKKATQAGNLILRHGVDSFMELCKEKDIKLSIVSAGIWNLIAPCLDQVPAGHIAKVFANVIEFDSQGMSSSFRKPLVHSLSKPMVLADEQLNKNILLLGDMPHDVLMVSHHCQDNVLSIGFFNDADRYNLADFQDKFDIICLHDGNFEVAELITAWVCGQERENEGDPSFHCLKAYRSVPKVIDA